jgi:hypothetical protein
MGRTDQSDRYRNPAIAAEWKWPKTASPDGRPQVGVIFPTQVVPDGVDITTVSLSIQRSTDDSMEEAIQGMERAAKGEHK